MLQQPERHDCHIGNATTLSDSYWNRACIPHQSAICSCYWNCSGAVGLVYLAQERRESSGD